jgi:hypothetical protein
LIFYYTASHNNPAPYQIPCSDKTAKPAARPYLLAAQQHADV